jgi:Type IV pili methyl-accepting chemotaxis transducer N-term
MLNRILGGLALALCLLGSPQASEDKLLEQINRASEQRMLGQRIAKSFSQLGLNVQPLVAKQELDEAILRFEANLAFLEAGAADAVKPAVEKLRTSWTPFRSAAKGVPRLPVAIWLAHQSDEVLAAADNVVRELQSAMPSTARASGRLVGQAGRQRMLSQRIVKSYLLLSWGDTSEHTREELDASVSEFSGALGLLRQRGENSNDVKRELEEMAQHWDWLLAALSAEGATSYRLIVAESGEAILQSADRLTQLYAATR